MTNITIYGKKGCTMCDRAKMLCQMNKLTFEYKDLDNQPELIDNFKSMSIAKLPVVFVDKDLIGGYEELYQYVRNNKGVKS